MERPKYLRVISFVRDYVLAPVRPVSRVSAWVIVMLRGPGVIREPPEGCPKRRPRGPGTFVLNPPRLRHQGPLARGLPWAIPFCGGSPSALGCKSSDITQAHCLIDQIIPESP